jgi:hypothetical protein
LFAACRPVTHSSYLDTKGLYVTYTVTRGVDAHLKGAAVFRDRDETGTPLVLDVGDDPSVDGQALVSTTVGTVPTYVATLDGGFTHHFMLARTGEDAVVKDLDDPPGFAPGFLDGGTAFVGAATSTVSLQWTAVAGAKVTIATHVASGGCAAYTVASEIDDPGGVTFGALALSPDGGPCVLSIDLERTTSAAIGAPFHGGSLGTSASVSTSVNLQ